MDFQGPPDFINELGVKWWNKGWDVWLTEFPDGEQKFVVIKEGAVVHEHTQLDAAGSYSQFWDLAKETP